MSERPPDRRREPIAWRDAAWLAIAAGLGAAAIELGVLGMRKYVRGLFVFLPVETIWLAPLATALLFVLLASALLAVGRVAGRRATSAQVAGFLAGLAVLTGLLMVPVLHQGASVLVAVGVGMTIARWRWAAGPAPVRWARAVVVVALPVVGLAAVGLAVGQRIIERRVVAALPAPAARTNVLLLVLDTVRAASLSAWGYERGTTPELEAWSRTATRFTNAESPSPWTLPSHASLFTGRWAHELPTNWYQPLDNRDLTLAEYLAEAGYLTAGFVANVGYAGRETGLARGFQHYEDFPIDLRSLAFAPALVRAVADHHLVRRLTGNREKLIRKDAGDINTAFLRWLDGRGDRPFFAFLNYYDAHTPFLPPEPFRSRFAPPGQPFDPDPTGQLAEGERWTPERLRGAQNAYDGAIASLDHALGRLFAALAERHLLDSTLVVVTSDHGEEFGEHGLFSHGNSLYRPALHVPLLLSLPGVVPAGDTIAAPVSIRDVAATIAELLRAPAAAPFPGRSLARHWREHAEPVPEPLFVEVRSAPNLPSWYPTARGDLIGVQRDRLMLIRNADGRLEAYDLARDPWEQRDVIGDAALAERIAALRALLDGARAHRAAGGTSLAASRPASDARAARRPADPSLAPSAVAAP